MLFLILNLNSMSRATAKKPTTNIPVIPLNSIRNARKVMTAKPPLIIERPPARFEFSNEDGAAAVE
jgi:hypothetical protein